MRLNGELSRTTSEAELGSGPNAWHWGGGAQGEWGLGTRWVGHRVKPRSSWKTPGGALARTWCVCFPGVSGRGGSLPFIYQFSRGVTLMKHHM